MSIQWIERLVNLQEVDLRIRDLNLRISMIPKEKQRLKDNANKNLASVNLAKEELQKLQLEQKRYELKIQQLKEQIAKLEQQSSLVKKNNEYEAMLHSIAEHKNEIDKFDDLILNLMVKIENLEAQLAKDTKNAKILNRSLKDEFLELEDLNKRLKEEVAKLTIEREKRADRVQTDILPRYNSLIKRDTGTPLSLIVDGICTNCHRTVTAHTVNSAKKGLVTYCDNCQYFLYLEENL